jgi:adenylate cyclase
MEVTLQHGGAIARLAGDGLLVFFGAPDLQPDHTRRAVECAIDMDHYCETFRATVARESVEFGVTRIGVHSGPAVVGNVGGSKRFEYTAYGESINIAARLESLNQHLGTRICISAQSLTGYAPGLFRPVGEVQLKGMSHGLEVYTLWGKLDESQQSICRQTYEKMRSRSDAVEKEVLEMSERLPLDPLTGFYLSRVRAGRSPVNIVMKEK